MSFTRVCSCLAAGLLLLGACTGSNASSTSPTSTHPTVSTDASPSASPTAFLAGAAPLPAGCHGPSLTEAETAAFAAEGRIWALDPHTGRLSCLLQSNDPGPFLWGPRGDRVLLGGFQVAGFGKAPSFPATGIHPAIEDWGHPIGIAIVFGQPDATHPQKFFLETNKTKTLRDLPAATYLDVAYHPTGLALGFILERAGSQSIWLSTNEGEQPKRLVFTNEGTTFSDVTFTHDGESLVYVAHHSAGYSEVHTIDLASPTTLNSLWKGPVGEYVRTVAPSPNDQRFAVTEGNSCQTSRSALLLGRAGERPLVPEAAGPSTIIGWLDNTTALVGVGGCGSRIDLYASDATGASAPDLLVTGVDAAASRAPAPEAPTSLPKEVQLDTGPGVG